MTEIQQPKKKWAFQKLSQYKWLFIAPVGLLILPFIVGILLATIMGVDPFDPSWPYLTNNSLWYLYQDSWFLPPLVIGSFVAALGYGGAKLRKTKNTIAGSLLIFISAGAYLVLLFFALLIAIYPGQ